MNDQNKPLTKSQFLSAIAEESGKTKQDIDNIWDSIRSVVLKQIGKNQNNTGEITLPGLLKIVRIEKPAKPAKKGVPNPFKPGELMDIEAKPAKCVLKLKPLKGLKDMIV